MDRIIIKDACFTCNVGVSSREREAKQEICVDAELYSDTKKAGSSDKVELTVDYSEVYKLIKNTVEKRKCRLIEAVAENISKSILREFSFEKVKINVRKKLQNKNLSYVGVEIERSRNG